MTARQALQHLVDDLPEREIPTAKRVLEALSLTDGRGRPTTGSPPAASAATNEEKRLLELGALGLVTPRESTVLKERKRVRIAGKPLSETVVEEREDRV